MIIKKRNIVRSGQDQVLRKAGELVHLRLRHPRVFPGGPPALDEKQEPWGWWRAKERGCLTLSCVLPATHVCLCEQKSPEYSSRSETVDATSPHGGAHTRPASTSMEDAETQTVLRVGGSFAGHSLS